MNHTTIYTDEPHDRYIIFMYENNRLCGMNFHHGIGDLDTEYLKNDQRLLDIYLTHAKLAGSGFNQVEVAQDAIREFLVVHNEHEQNFHIERVAEMTTAKMLDMFSEQLYLPKMEMENSHINRLEAIQELMDELMRDIYKFNTKK